MKKMIIIRDAMNHVNCTSFTSFQNRNFVLPEDPDMFLIYDALAQIDSMEGSIKALDFTLKYLRS